MLNLPALLHIIPSAVLHDALLVVGRDVRSDEKVLELDLAGQDVNVFQQVLPFPLEAALQVCHFCPFALETALQLLQLFPFGFYFFLSAGQVQSFMFDAWMLSHLTVNHACATLHVCLPYNAMLHTCW